MSAGLRCVGHSGLPYEVREPNHAGREHLLLYVGHGPAVDPDCAGHDRLLACDQLGLTGAWFAAGVQVLNSIGALCLVYAMRYGKAIIVAPMTAMAPVLTIIISLVMYHTVPGSGDRHGVGVDFDLSDGGVNAGKLPATRTAPGCESKRLRPGSTPYQSILRGGPATPRCCAPAERRVSRCRRTPSSGCGPAARIHSRASGSRN